MATPAFIRSQSSSFRLGLAVSGIVAAVIGLLILIWPDHTAVVVTGMIAAYAVIGGLIYVVLGWLSDSLTKWARIGHIIVGLFFVVLGVFALTKLNATTTAIFTLIGVLVGILWLAEGLLALMTLGSAQHKVPTLIFALCSLALGVVLLFSPMFASVLWLWMGASLLLLGGLQLVRALMWKHGEKANDEG